jgi:hypothetical protein
MLTTTFNNVFKCIFDVMISEFVLSVVDRGGFSEFVLSVVDRGGFSEFVLSVVDRGGFKSWSNQ